MKNKSIRSINTREWHTSNSIKSHYNVPSISSLNVEDLMPLIETFIPKSINWKPTSAFCYAIAEFRPWIYTTSRKRRLSTRTTCFQRRASHVTANRNFKRVTLSSLRLLSSKFPRRLTDYCIYQLDILLVIACAFPNSFVNS